MCLAEFEDEEGDEEVDVDVIVIGGRGGDLKRVEAKNLVSKELQSA